MMEWIYRSPHQFQTNYKEDFVDDVGTLIQPGDSAIFAQLHTADPAVVAAQFSDYGGYVLQSVLKGEK